MRRPDDGVHLIVLEAGQWRVSRINDNRVTIRDPAALRRYLD